MSQSYHHQQLNEEGEKFVNQAVNETLTFAVEQARKYYRDNDEYSMKNLMFNIISGCLVKIGYGNVGEKQYETFSKMIAEHLLLNLKINADMNREK